MCGLPALTTTCVFVSSQRASARRLPGGICNSFMATESTIQTAVWQIELGRGKIFVYWFLVVLLALGLALVYTASEFRGLHRREAIDQAQIARNLARGEGFTTYVIRPLSIWHLKNYSKDGNPRIDQHPDLYHAPLYPAILAGLFRLFPESLFEFKTSDQVYAPERWVIVPFGQLCMLLSLVLVYLWAKQLFDGRVALTAGLLLLGADALWRFSITGLNTNLLLLLFLVSLYALHRADRLTHGVASESTSGSPFAVWAWLGLSAVVLGLCFLTRYVTLGLLIPFTWYVARILRGRSAVLGATIYAVVALAVLTPWLVRNWQISSRPFGIAHYDIGRNTGVFAGDLLPRTLDPTADNQLSESRSVSRVSSRMLSDTRRLLFVWLPTATPWLLLGMFATGVMYRFRRDDVVRLRSVVIGTMATMLLAVGLSGSGSERDVASDLTGDNLLWLFLPLITVYAVAFFYLLLDRIPFRYPLTRGLAIATFAFLNLLPLIYTLLPPRKGNYEYPPYMPPVTKAVAEWFDRNEIGCSDLPWAMAWYGNRRCVWLPATIEEFYEIHDFVIPRERKGFAFLFLTPYMLDRPLTTQLFKGEYKGWSTVVRGRMPERFPLRAATTVPPGNDQFIFADRTRWRDQRVPEPQLERRPKPSTTSTEESPDASR